MTLALPPQKEWLTAAEAAAEQLPGFTYDERHIRRLIQGDPSATRKRIGPGGGREFHYTLLPREAQAAYLKKHAIASPAKIEHAGAHKIGKDLVAEARAEIVTAAWKWIACHHLTRREGVPAFCAAYAARKVKLDDWIYNAVPTIAPHQPGAWRSKLVAAKGAWSGLIDGRGRPAVSKLRSDFELSNFIAVELARHPHWSATTLREAIAKSPDGEEYQGLGRKVALRTLQAFIAPLRPERNALMKFASDPDKGKSHHGAALGSRSQGVVRLNQLWEMDATKADCMCIVPGQPPRRVSLTAIVDVTTRRAMVVVSDQPRADASRAVMRRACIDWGMPETLKTDNGKEFKNKAVDRFCAEASIALDFCAPYHPEQKPHVERFFGTLLHQLFEKLPGYVGHDVAQRKAIESRKSFAQRFGEEARLTFDVELSPADLQHRIDVWLKHTYETNYHSELGMPPRTKALAHADQVRVADVRALDALMMNVVERSISKGIIRIANRFYGSEDTGALEVSVAERKVQCRIDPLDPTWIAVYSADGATFLCVARDLDLLDPKERQRVAIAALQNQNKVVRLFRRRVQTAGNKGSLIDQVLADAAGVPSLTLDGESARGMIAAAGGRLLEHKDMAAARDAMDVPAQPIELTDEQREDAAAERAEREARDAPRPLGFVQCDGYRRPEFLDDDFGFFAWAEARLGAGEPVDARDYARLEELKTDETFARMRANRKRAAESA